MPLSERQELAQSLADQLRRIGAHCTSPLPLREGDALRFDVLNNECDAVLGKLATWGWSPKPRDKGVRFVRQDMGVIPAPTTFYEIDLPPSKEPEGTQTHFGELADPAVKARKKRLGIR